MISSSFLSLDASLRIRTLAFDALYENDSIKSTSFFLFWVIHILKWCCFTVSSLVLLSKHLIKILLQINVPIKFSKQNFRNKWCNLWLYVSYITTRVAFRYYKDKSTRVAHPRNLYWNAKLALTQLDTYEWTLYLIIPGKEKSV